MLSGSCWHLWGQPLRRAAQAATLARRARRVDILPNTSVLWRRLAQPGHESALLNEGADGAVIEGTAVFSESGRPCRLDYRIVCDAAWRTLSARVAGWLDTMTLDIAVGVDAARGWTINGRSCPDLHGCDDIDLSFSPATNLLPIRRTRLAVGAQISVRAAWLRFPDVTLEPLDQTYARVSESRYRYESGGGSFVAMLETNAVGFVTLYPGLWQLEEFG
jgi:hypothetical protein